MYTCGDNEEVYKWLKEEEEELLCTTQVAVRAC